MILFFLILAQAPSFNLPDLSKNEVFLDSLVNKGFVVLDFWATWCKPCIRELDDWQKLMKEFETHSEIPSDTGTEEPPRGQNVIFVGINEDGPRTQREVPFMVKSRGWEFLILCDNNRKVQKLFQVKAIPHTFIIGKGREILYEHIGYKKKDEDLLRKKLESLLKESEELE